MSDFHYTNDAHLMRIWGCKILDKEQKTSISEIDYTTRLDILVKIELAKNIINGSTLVLVDYKNCIDVMTGGNFNEPGQPNKNSFDKYVESLKYLCDRSNDPNDFTIPINKNNIPYDGSHRLAVAIARGMECVNTISIDDDSWIIDYGKLAQSRRQYLD